MPDLRLKRVAIEGFRSFADRQTFQLSAGSGLAFLTGVNDVNPAMEGNAVGKSTILEAVVWVLYGKTSRGLKAGAIKNWHSRNKCSVELWMIIDGKLLVLRRTWSPNSLTIKEQFRKPRIVEQYEVDGLVGLGYKEFVSSVIVPQFGDMFADQAPTAKSQIFTDLLSLDYWDNLVSKAKDVSEELEDEVDGIRRKIGKLEVEAAAIDITYLEKVDKAWRSENKNKLVSMKKAKAALQRRIEKANAELKESQHKANYALQKTQAVEDQLEFLEEEVKVRQKNISGIDKVIAVKREKVRLLSKEVDKMEKLQGKQCPTCRQAVTKDHSKKELASLRGHLKVVERFIRKKVGISEGLIKEVDELREEWGRMEAKFIANRRAYDKHKKAFVAAQTSVAMLTKDLSRVGKEVEEAQKDKSPYAYQLSKATDRLEVIGAELSKLRKKAKEVEGKVGAYKYWVTGFRDIRLFVINEVLAQLEVESNNVLNMLGMVGWKMSFAVDRLTKSKTVRKGFNVVIQAPGMKLETPWESWSGGEGQRLRLAMQLGLSNLILNRKGVTINLQAFDEPTSWLSGEGVAAVVEMLAFWAQANNRTVWLIDHRTIEFGGFCKTAVVRMTDEGSVVEYKREGGYVDG